MIFVIYICIPVLITTQITEKYTGCLKKNFLLPNLAFANIAVDGEKSNNLWKSSDGHCESHLG